MLVACAISRTSSVTGQKGGGSPAAGAETKTSGLMDMKSQGSPEQLSDIAIQRGLGSLQGWARKNDVLTKTFHFDSFPLAIAFVTRVAELAEAAQHHPDIDIRYTRVTCALTTHDAGGITQKDLDMAREIQRAAA